MTECPKTDTVGKRLRIARMKLELSQSELSTLAGLSKGHVRMIEEAEIRDAGARPLGALAGVLGISLDWLCLGRGRAPRLAAMRQAVAQARSVRERKGTTA